MGRDLGALPMVTASPLGPGEAEVLEGGAWWLFYPSGCFYPRFLSPQP